MPLSTPFSLFTGYSAPAKEVKASSEDLMKVKRPFYKDLFPSGYQAPSQEAKASSQNVEKVKLPLYDIFFPSGLLIDFY